MLVPVVVDVPGLVGDHEIVAARIDGILEDHEVGDQHLVHAADGLEAVQIVLARFQLDMPRLAGQPRAQRMDALAAGFQQPRHRILRQPVDLQVGMQLAQFPRDGDVAPPMAEADGRGEIKRLLGFAAARPHAVPALRMPSLRSRKSLIRALHLAGKRPSGLCPPPGMVTSSAPVISATSLRARIGLDLVVVAMDHQHGAA